MAPGILVVDDDRDIREALADILAIEGYEVRSAENAAHALELIREGAVPDLVLLDLMMPVMSGWEFLVLAEEDEVLQKIPVLVVSALPAPLSPPECPGGVKACLHKPIQLPQLLDLVRRYSGSPERALQAPN